MKPKDRIDQVAITNDGRYLVAGTSFGLVYVYDIGHDPPQPVRTIETGSNGNMYSLVVTEDNTTIITAGGTNNWNGEDGAGVIDVWDIKTGKRIYKIGKLGSLPLVALQGNSLILSSYRRLWVEDTKTGKETLMHPKQKDGGVSTLAISKSKTMMVSAGWDNRIVNIWNIPSFDLKMSVPTRHSYYTARISPDDKSVVLMGSSYGKVVVMDLQSGSIIREIQVHPSFEPTTIFISPDSKCIISLQSPGIKKVFQISDGKEVMDKSVCNIPLGKIIAQSENDYIVAADKVNDGIDKITVHSAVGRALWEVDLSPYSYERGDSALLSPDGQYVFFALRTGINKPGAIIQFSRDSGKRIREVETNSCCVLAANKKYLISGGDDKRAVVWDIATGKQLHRFYGHQAEISAIQIVDDVAITAAFDGQIFVWSLPEGKLKKILRHQ